MRFQQSEISEQLNVLSALSDSDRLQIYLCVQAAGPNGVTIKEIGSNLGFIHRRIARSLRWLKRANVIEIVGTDNFEKITLNLSTINKLKNTL